MIEESARSAAKRGRSSRPRVGLQGRIVAVLLLVSLLPLGIMASGVWVVFGRLVEQRSLELQRSVVEAHAAAIEGYLSEHLRVLELAARAHGLDELRSPGVLAALLDDLNGTHEEAFVDLGVIGPGGEHLAYSGPYDLGGRNYAQAGWFKDVKIQGSYVSDVFLGFRGVPHCVMAVRRQEQGGFWILRATINSEKFDALVRTGRLGSTGDSFIVSAGGEYQTPPVRGKVLDQSPLIAPVPHRGVEDSRLVLDGTPVIQTSIWLNRGRWMLVVQQHEAEIMAPLHRASIWGGLVLLLSVALIVVTTYVATRHLTNRIAVANAERERMSRDLMRSAKLASLGELSTGLAHEINNPLAIISTEMTNISDIETCGDGGGSHRDEILASVERCNRQVVRCSAITSKMLQFGRAGSPRRQPTDIGPKLLEITELMRKQAQVRNVELVLEVDPDLPLVDLDPTELQQVIVNLINNGVYAISGSGVIQIRASDGGSEVIVSVRDTGSGIAEEDLERIFQPFFTTKPVGKGTGLGLSVCFGIVRGWGGSIRAESRPGAGTTMTLHLPVHASSAIEDRSAGTSEVRT